MTTKNKKILNSFILILGVFLFTSFVVAEVTQNNVSNWLSQQNSVYEDGIGQNRSSSDFSEDGCGSGTILDETTGLCWDSNLNRNGSTMQWALDTSYGQPEWDGTQYIWPTDRTEDDYPAFKHCNNLEHGGHSDWRLPTRLELYTLVHKQGDGSTCPALEDVGFSNCHSSIYWSETERGSSTTRAFRVNFNFGTSYSDNKEFTRYVACVRRD